MAVPASSGQLINQSSQPCCCSTLDDGDRGNDKLPAIEGLLTDASPLSFLVQSRHRHQGGALQLSRSDSNDMSMESSSLGDIV